MDRPYQQALHLAVLAELMLATAASSSAWPPASETHTATKQIAHLLSCGMSGLFIVDLDFVVDDTADALRRSGIDCGVIQAGKKFVEGKRIYAHSLQTIIACGIRPPADFSSSMSATSSPGPSAWRCCIAYPDALHLGADSDAAAGRRDGARELLRTAGRRAAARMGHDARAVP